jgi:choline/glycine/proline betaine transport protein
VLTRLTEKLGLETNPAIFWSTAAVALVFVTVTIAFTEQVAETFATVSAALLDALGWFYILGVTTFLIALAWFALGKHGRVRLGGDDERPKYSDVAWFGMLFAAGIGTILMFWGVAEPISHYAEPPMAGVEPQSVAAAEQALSFTLYHFGLHTWAIFGLPALGFAYFAHRKGLPMRVSSVLHPLLGDRIHGPFGHALDTLAALGTLFGVAVSLGLGTLQLGSGLASLTGLEDSLATQVVIIAVITAVAVGSVALGLDAGIKRLSNLNIGLAVTLLVFVLAFGPTLLVLRGAVESTGRYLTDLPQLAFWTDAIRDTGWQDSWTVFYWAWTITWAPFVGIFIARISRGRTIRQFVGGVLVAPTIFTIIWFTTFGLSAIDLDASQGGQLSELITSDPDNVPLSLFAFLESLPLATVISWLAVLIVVIFFTTSSDSASLVIDMLTSSDVSTDPPTRQRVAWAITEGAVAATLLSAGGLEALQDVITVLGLPFFLLGLVIIWSLARALRSEEPVRTRVTRYSAASDHRSPERDGDWDQRPERDQVSADGHGPAGSRDRDEPAGDDTGVGA